jgi:hypothetical protein
MAGAIDLEEEQGFMYFTLFLVVPVLHKEQVAAVTKNSRPASATSCLTESIFASPIASIDFGLPITDLIHDKKRYTLGSVGLVFCTPCLCPSSYSLPR